MSRVRVATAVLALVVSACAVSACSGSEHDHDHDHDLGADVSPDVATAADEVVGSDVPSADGGADSEPAGVAVPEAIAGAACAANADSAAPKTLTAGGAALVLQPGEVVLVDVPAAGKYPLALTTTGPHSNVYVLLDAASGAAVVGPDLDTAVPIAPDCGPWLDMLTGHIHEAGAHLQTLQVAGPQKVLIGYWSGH